MSKLKIYNLFTGALYQLWKKFDGEIVKFYPLEMLDMKLVDSSLPEAEQVVFTLRDLIEQKGKELDAGKKLAESEPKRAAHSSQGKRPNHDGRSQNHNQ